MSVTLSSYIYIYYIISRCSLLVPPPRVHTQVHGYTGTVYTGTQLKTFQRNFKPRSSHDSDFEYLRTYKIIGNYTTINVLCYLDPTKRLLTEKDRIHTVQPTLCTVYNNACRRLQNCVCQKQAFNEIKRRIETVVCILLLSNLFQDQPIIKTLLIFSGSCLYSPPLPFPRPQFKTDRYETWYRYFNVMLIQKQNNYYNSRI